MARARSAGRELLVTLEGRDCQFCADGELVRDEYRGNDAVLCETCGTPIAQLW